MENKNIFGVIFVIGVLIVLSTMIYIIWTSLNPIFAIFLIGLFLLIIGGTSIEN